MKALSKLALVLAGVVAAACAPSRPAAEPEAGAYERGVEVANFTRERVEVHYYLAGSTVPQYLGSVGASDRGRFLLPDARVSGIHATGTGGQRIYTTSAVRIRRVRL